MTPESTPEHALIDAYFAAWNAHDPARVSGTFALGGTYHDPTLPEPIAASELSVKLAALWAAFPDLSFELAPPSGLHREWVMRGHNRGPFFSGLPPTERFAEARGITVFELSASGIRSARSYFDQKAFVESFGLMALVQPIEQGPAQFGYSMRVSSGNPNPPGVIAVTWIQGANEGEKERIRAHARANVKDFLAEPGFISIVTGFTGLRGFTVTAWEDEASLHRALSKHHAVAMNELFSERFVAAVWTSVWTPTRINRLWVRCPACGSLEDENDDHRSCSRCQQSLPPRPAFW